MRKGIDISQWQGSVDFSAVKRDVDYVIMRCGYGDTIDPRFLEYAASAKAVGLDIHGLYHFVYALNTEEARRNARAAVEFAKRAGIPEGTRIWCDVEYDTVDHAAKMGVHLGAGEINMFTCAFCDTVLAAGYKTGIYSNMDYISRCYTEETLRKYPLWLADYSGGPDYPCIEQQYSCTGRVSGISGDVDMNYCYCPECDFEDAGAGGKEIRDPGVILMYAKEWLGRNEWDGSHRTIIDIYNSFLPHPRGYQVQYNDAWCAAFISALAIHAGYTDIIPVECGCPQMIQIAQQMGIWVEDDAYIPKPGDIILYDWDDTGTGDCVGVPDHVGLVTECYYGMIRVIEGNYNGTVQYRDLSVNGRYIRGYICPKYECTVPVVVPEITPQNASGYLTKGLSGEKVAEMQDMLCVLGYEPGPIDGEFGDKTEAALIKFQTFAGVEPDGIYGPITKEKLEYFYEQKSVDSAPTYHAGMTYRLYADLRVRAGAGTGYTAKKHKQLTKDGQKHDKNKDGCLDNGTYVTCQEVKKVGEDIWIRCPSGWLAAYYKGNVFIS